MSKQDRNQAQGQGLIIHPPPPEISQITSLLLNYSVHGDLSLSGAVLTLTAPGLHTEAHVHTTVYCQKYSLVYFHTHMY